MIDVALEHLQKRANVPQIKKIKKMRERKEEKSKKSKEKKRYGISELIQSKSRAQS